MNFKHTRTILIALSFANLFASEGKEESLAKRPKLAAQAPLQDSSLVNQYERQSQRDQIRLKETLGRLARFDYNGPLANTRLDEDFERLRRFFPEHDMMSEVKNCFTEDLTNLIKQRKKGEAAFYSPKFLSFWHHVKLAYNS